MENLFKDFLFTRHILVNDSHDQNKLSDAECFSAISMLASKFAIRIMNGANLVTIDMIKDAARNLGEYVPEPFYRGFPQSVLSMTPDERLYDQLLHYTQTYGLGWWEEPGHSLREKLHESFDKSMFPEQTEPKDFVILSEEKAKAVLIEAIKGLLSVSRPLSIDHMIIVQEGYKAFGKDILPEWIPCKITAIDLMYRMKDISFCKYLVLSDVIKLLALIQYKEYGSENLKKLNLKNKDRKFITAVIDTIISQEHYDYTVCFEKRKIWCGLLHHIHYQSKNPGMCSFIKDIRDGKNRSAYHLFERFMKTGNYRMAAATLANMKGKSDLLRHMNYILSRCKTKEEIEEVFSCLE